MTGHDKRAQPSSTHRRSVMTTKQALKALGFGLLVLIGVLGWAFVLWLIRELLT